MRHFPLITAITLRFFLQISPLYVSFLLRLPSCFSFLRPGRVWLFLLAAPLLLASCATTKYSRQRTLLRLTTGADGVVDTAKLRRAVNRTARNYLVHPNDYLSVQVFTNKGERKVDPNNAFQIGTQGSGAPSSTITRTTGGTSAGGATNTGSSYLVQADGTVKLPLVDRVKVIGLTLIQVDSVLQLRYNIYYKESFVQTAVANNRVIILGAPGGLVVPLANDNMNLLEVLALAGGTDGGGSGGGFSRYGGRTDNIRIIRGDLKNPQVQFIDLSTLEGMRRGNLQVEPNDIIYIQPVRRPFLEGLTDAGPVIGLVTTALSTVSLVFSLITIARSR